MLIIGFFLSALAGQELTTGALYCWDFTHHLLSVPDGDCSGQLVFSPTSDAPICDGSGCNFHDSSPFATTLAHSFESGWTFVFWAMVFSPSGALLQAKVGRSDTQRVSSQIINLERSLGGLEGTIGGATYFASLD